MFAFCVYVTYKLMCLRRLYWFFLSVFLRLSAGVRLHDCCSTFSDASPYSQQQHHHTLVHHRSACVSMFTSLRVTEVLSIAYMSTVVNCFSSAGRLALLWLEIGVLTQRLEDGLYLMLASGSQ